MYDLHTHTYYSDGSESPSSLISMAKEAGLQLVGVTDHDTTEGLAEAAARAAELGLPMLRGVEIEAEYPSKLHILGLGIDPSAECIDTLLTVQKQRREERNERMLDKLASAGMDVRPFFKRGRGCTTRTHVAAALVAAGFAENTADAFTRFIGRGMPMFVPCEHPSMKEAVGCISRAGGLAVLAHPCKMRCDHRELIRELAECGLWGVEAHYPGCSEETITGFARLAAEFGLHVTCGSDFHGAYRPSSPLGCAWRKDGGLEASFEILRRLAK